MKRTTLSIAILLSTLFLACAKEQEKDLSKAIAMAKSNYLFSTNPDYMYIKNIYEEFPAIEPIYSFSKDEKEAIGMWNPSLYDWTKNNYYFTLFPNRLAFLWVSIELEQKPRTHIRKLFGIWEISDNTIYIEAYGYEYYIPAGSNSEYTHFLFSKPVKYKILDTNAIDPDGYTIKWSYKITLPNELLREYKIKIKQIDGDIYYRNFKYKTVIQSDTYHYNEFEYLEEMAKLGITGEMIIKDPEKYRKYLVF